MQDPPNTVVLDELENNSISASGSERRVGVAVDRLGNRPMWVT
jgi:hypothetical protein